MGFFDSDVERDLVYETPEDFKSGLADLLAEAKIGETGVDEIFHFFPTFPLFVAFLAVCSFLSHL